MSRETIQKVLMIPADPRTGKPAATTAMKAACMGEFSLESVHTCPYCFSGESGPDKDCLVCGGKVTYTIKQDIPWDTMKGIYKMMAGVASAEITPSIPAPVLTVGFDPGGKGDRAALAVRIGDVLGTFIVEPAKVASEPKTATEELRLCFPTECPKDIIPLLSNVSKGDAVKISTHSGYPILGIKPAFVTVTDSDPESFRAGGLWFFRDTGEAYTGNSVIIGLVKKNQ